MHARRSLLSSSPQPAQVAVARSQASVPGPLLIVDPAPDNSRARKQTPRLLACLTGEGTAADESATYDFRGRAAAHVDSLSAYEPGDSLMRAGRERSIMTTAALSSTTATQPAVAR